MNNNITQLLIFCIILFFVLGLWTGARLPNWLQRFQLLSTRVRYLKREGDLLQKTHVPEDKA